MSDLPPASGASGLAGLETQTAQAAAALSALAQPAQAAADAIDQAFAKAGASLASTLAKAAADGKLSLSDLASAVISAVDAFGRTSAGGSLTGALASAISGVFGGARADGGPVGSGGAYLVGERGPEVFRPAGSGDVTPLAGGGGTTVNVVVQGGGAPGLLRSEAQIASALARAVALGAR